MLASVFLSTSTAAGCLDVSVHWNVSHHVGRFDLPRDEVLILFYLVSAGFGWVGHVKMALASRCGELMKWCFLDLGNKLSFLNCHLKLLMLCC